MATTARVTLEDFSPGMNNRRPDTRLDAGEGKHFLRNAVNVDVTTEGTVKRRTGAELALAGTNCHSLWADGDDAFFVQGTTLHRLGGSPALPITTDVRTGLRPQQPVSFARLPDGDVVYSDGAVLRRISSSGDAPLHPAPLTQMPTVTAAGGGALPAGRYQLCFTQSDAAGRESPSTPPVQVEVGAGGSLAVTQIPVLGEGAVRTNIYMTAVNGSVLQRAFATTAASFSVLVVPPPTGQCSTLLLQLLPPGDIVRYHDGRLLVASGSVLFYSVPFGPGLYEPQRGYVLFPAAISVLEPVQGGVYVVADRTYWLAGDIGAADLTTALPYGAVPRSGFYARDEEAAYWMSARGLCKGAPGGVVKNLQEGAVVVTPGSLGASFMVERDGMKQALSSVFGVQPSVSVAASFMEAEVLQEGTQL